tara:strand:+ start:207 stop:398 length:192 start_codon:yes stop_codon:yes gene_type:complete
MKCKNKPSAYNYSNGCRCADCREAWRLHQEEDRTKKRKGTKRDTPVVEHDAFTREQILAARGM